MTMELVMKYVLVERAAGQVAQADVRRNIEQAGARIVSWRGHIGLIEFEGSIAELLTCAGGLPGWLVSEHRIYRLAGEATGGQ